MDNFNYNMFNYNQPIMQEKKTNKLFTTGLDDVKNKWQPFNSDYLYIDNDKPLIYQKIVDNNGNTIVKTFSINEIKEKEKADITKEDYDNLCNKFSKLEEQLSKLLDKGGQNEPIKQ